MAARVVFVNRYFHPDHSATSQMLSDVSFHLAQRGWDVEVVTSRQRYEDASAKLPPRETVNGVTVRRGWGGRVRGGVFSGRAGGLAAVFWGAGFLRRLAGGGGGGP